MKQRTRTVALVISSIVAFAGEVCADEWVGPDILNFSSSGWTTVGNGSWGWSTNADGGCNKRMGVGTVVDTRRFKSIPVISGKRYRISGRIEAVDGHLGGNFGDIRTRIEVPGLASTSWENNGANYRVAEGISPSANVEFRLVADIVSISFPINNPHGGFECPEMHQVILDPQMDIVESAVQTITDEPNSDFAHVELQMLSLSYADEPSTWEIDWGDGVVEQFPSLSGFESHVYELDSTENEHTWMATLTGSNIAGIGQDTVTVAVTRRPPCPADLTNDGELDFFDVSVFLTFFQLGDLTVDFTGDGDLDFFDVSAFLQAFTVGCP